MCFWEEVGFNHIVWIGENYFAFVSNNVSIVPEFRPEGFAVFNAPAPERVIIREVLPGFLFHFGFEVKEGGVFDLFFGGAPEG